MVLMSNKLLFSVYVFEPAVDPGGYQRAFPVKAANEEVARKVALSRAEATFPDNKGLEVWKVEIREPW